MKKGFYGLAALIIAVACYGVHVTYNSKNGLTRLTLLNVEALAMMSLLQGLNSVTFLLVQHYYQTNPHFMLRRAMTAIQ